MRISWGVSTDGLGMVLMERVEGGLSEGGGAYCLHCFTVGVMGDAWFAHGSFVSKSPTGYWSELPHPSLQNPK